MKPPVKGIPVEVNRRLDELSRKTRRETIIKTIREIPVVGYQSYPTISLKENIDLGEWIATDTSIKLSAQPSGEHMYEFAIQKTGEESWDAKITKENTVIFAGLRPDTSYNCKVRSLSFDGGYSPWSPLVMVVTTKDTTPPPVPEGLALVADFYYIRAKVDEIKTEDYPDFAGFEFHASTVTGFTPSDSTFKDACRTVRTVFHVSDVGITWYVKVRSFDNNGNYSDYCTQVSVVVPVPHLPPQDTDPTGPGDIVIVEGIEELDDCDDHTKWTTEVGGIQLATDTGTLKEGAGALRISIDKYAPVAENLWYNYQPEIPGMFIIGGLASKYVVQGFKVDANCDLKREAIIAWIGSGTPPGLKVMLYDDDGAGNPDNLLGTATFAGVNADEYWRFAEYAAAISITADTQYHKIYCRSDEAVGDYYRARVGVNNYSDGVLQYGNALNDLTKDETRDVIFRCFDDTATLNQHFKVTTLGAKDISTHENLEHWIKSNKTVASWLQASMGEAALGEQTDNITPGTTWGAEAWNISGIAAASRNAIAHFGFKVLDSDPLANPPSADDGKVWVWVDYIRATKEKAVKVKFTDYPIVLWPQFPVGYRDGCRPKYKGVADIYINTGKIEIDGFGASLNDDLTVTWADLDTGAEAPSTWYYLYLVKPAADGDAPTAKISVTAPSAGFRGRYHGSHPTWRCVGAFYNDSLSDIEKFKAFNDGYVFWDAPDDHQVLNNGSATTWTDIDCSAHAPDFALRAGVVGFANNPTGSVQTIYGRPNGSTGNGMLVMKLQANGGRITSHFEIETDANGIFEYKVENSNVDLDLWIKGWWEDL